MIFSILGILLKEKPCFKFMLKYDTRNHFRQFVKTLNTCLQWNTTQKLGDLKLFLTWTAKGPFYLVKICKI